MTEGPGRDWLAFHFFHHQDRDLLLRECVLPLAMDARGAGAERFFFVRYILGGPHIRLRLELPHGKDPREIEALVADRAADFFARCPSTVSREAEDIARANRLILAGDPNETDDRALPDNHWERAAYRPEVARYGGEHLLDLSYDLFMASSLAAGEFLKQTAGLKDTQVFPRKMILLGKLAAALAQSHDELEPLLSYGPHWWPAFAPLAASAEKRFAGGGEIYLELWRRTLSPPGDSPILRHLVATAKRLRQGLGAAPKAPNILASHLHMTANRLGLDNANEVFALALLAQAHQRHGPAVLPETEARSDFFAAAVAALSARIRTG